MPETTPQDFPSAPEADALREALRLAQEDCARLRAENMLLGHKVEALTHELAALTRLLTGSGVLELPAVALPAPGGTGRRGLWARLWGKKRRQADKILQQQAAACERAGIVDALWYSAQYPDVLASGMDPALHFIRFGMQERRKPNPDFDWSRDAQRLRELLQAQSS